MIVPSILRKLIPPKSVIVQATRNVDFPQGGHKFTAVPTNWMWLKFKDYVHFYFFVAAIPAGLISFYSTVFIGPATLTPIPEGYDPKDEEYHKHPITRFIVRYMWSNYRENYERRLHVNWIDVEQFKRRQVENHVKAVMREKRDIKGSQYQPILTKYHKEIRKLHRESEIKNKPPFV